jgi:hypothetical protein
VDEEEYWRAEQVNINPDYKNALFGMAVWTLDAGLVKVESMEEWEKLLSRN